MAIYHQSTKYGSTNPLPFPTALCYNLAYAQIIVVGFGVLFCGVFRPLSD